MPYIICRAAAYNFMIHEVFYGIKWTDSLVFTPFHENIRPLSDHCPRA